MSPGDPSSSRVFPLWTPDSSLPPHPALPVQTLGSLQLLELNSDAGRPGVITCAPSLCNAHPRNPQIRPPDPNFLVPCHLPRTPGCHRLPNPATSGSAVPSSWRSAERGSGLAHVSVRDPVPPRVRNLVLHAGLLRRGPRAQPPPRRALGRCTTRRNSCQGQSRAQVAPRPRHSPDATAS